MQTPKRTLKTERLIKLTIKLCSGEKIIIKDEAEYFDVSEKTIKRDLLYIGKFMQIDSDFKYNKALRKRTKFFFKA